MSADKKKKETLTTQLLNWVVIFLILSTALIPLVIIPEFAKWRIAIAVEDFANQKYDKAIAGINLAIKNDPQNWQLRSTRSNWLLEMQEYDQILTDSDETISLMAKTDQSFLFPKTDRISALIGLGETDAAVQEMAELELSYFANSVDPEIPRTPDDSPAENNQQEEEKEKSLDISEISMFQLSLLNTLAYSRALCNSRLDQALEDSNLTLMTQEIHESHAAIASLYLALEDYEKAIEYYSKALATIDTELTAMNSDVKKEMAKAMELGLPMKGKTKTEVSSLVRKRRSYQLASARWCRARAYAYEKNSDAERAAKDRAKAEKINPDATPFDWNQLVLRSFHLCGQEAAFIDTRGTVYWKRKEYEKSLKDLDMAIQMSDLRIRCMIELPPLFPSNSFGNLSPSKQVRTVDQAQYERVSKRSLATMLYHRSELYMEIGKTELSERDRSRVIDLGFTPSPQLF